MVAIKILSTMARGGKKSSPRREICPGVREDERARKNSLTA